MPSGSQAVLNELLASPAYKPRVPVALPETWALVEDFDDPETLPCLETLGDSRIGYLLAEKQVALFPTVSPSLHR
ncbi:hypothetical protein B0H16DRAFT_1692541, partial [Mycena metata]